MAENDGGDLSAGILSGGAGRRRNVLNSTKMGARVNVEGVRSIVTEFRSFLTVLREVRKELDALNKSGGMINASGGAPGFPSSTGNQNAQRFASMVYGFRTNSGLGGGLMGFALGAMSGTGFNSLMDRTRRNMQESIPISQNSMLLSSRFGMSYGGIEPNTLAALGRYAGTRQDAASAFNIALSLGQTSGNAMSYLSSVVAPLVQASGGTMTSSQAAASGSVFLDPMIMRRGMAMGVTPGRVNGVVRNPLTVAQDYIKSFEQSRNVRLNEIDFANMQSPGSPMRYMFKRLYGLTDEAVDVIVQAGQQNLTFQSKTGTSRAINFGSSSDLEAIGLSPNRLGLKAFERLTASSRREARFFRGQEGAMVSRLNQDITIEDTLADVEDAFGGVIGKLYEFERVVKAVSIGLGALSAIGGMGGMGVGGGGLPGAVLSTALGRGGGGAGGAGGMGMMARGLGVAAGAAGLYAASSYGATHGGAMGAVVGIGGSAASGALIGAFVGGAPGAAVGAVIGGGIGAYRFLDGKHGRDVSKGRKSAWSMTDEEIISQLDDRGSMQGIFGLNGKAGPWSTGAMDVLQQRRAALLAAMLTDANDAGLFNNLSGREAANISDSLAFFSSGNVTDDSKFFKAALRLDPALRTIRGSDEGRKIYERYFGTMSDPYALAPINTEENKAMVMSNQDIIGGSTGDGSYDSGSAKGTSGPSWENLDSRMKTRLNQLFAASGGKVWLGQGWRSSEDQKSMFLSRYKEDPNGEITWNGKRWKHVSGAPAAPPGRSMHEIGLAADIQGDMNWLQQNAPKYGLKTFADVNGEPWHVQLSELPNSRSQYEGGGTSGSTSSSYVGDSGTSLSGGGKTFTGSAASGINFSIASSGAGSWTGAAGLIARSSSSGGAATGSSGALTSEAVAQMAYKAGFRGADLVSIVGIVMRESGNNPRAFNGNRGTGDQSYGLTQINMLGSMGPDRLGMFGISSADQLFDPQTNLNAAFKLYQASGNSLRPWGGYKGKSNTFNTDLNAAQAAVSAAGLGDGTFAAGPGSGGGPMVIMHVTNQVVASGNLGYDVGQLFDATMSRVHEATEMTMKRQS